MTTPAILAGYAGANEIEQAMAHLEKTDAAFRDAPPHRKPHLAGQWLKAQTSGPVQLGDAAGDPKGGILKMSDAQKGEASELLRTIIENLEDALGAMSADDFVKALTASRSSIDSLIGMAKVTAKNEAPAPTELTDPERRNKVLMSFSGANNLERAVSYLRQHSAGFADHPWHRQVWLAGRFCNTGKVEL